MSFPKQVFITCGAICALAAYPLMKYGSGGIQKAALAGGVVATLNILAGYATIEYSVNKSMNTFMKYVFGGMGLRLAVMAVLLVALIRLFGFDPTGLVTSLGVFYVAYLVLEIIFIQKKLSLRQDR